MSTKYRHFFIMILICLCLSATVGGCGQNIEGTDSDKALLRAAIEETGEIESANLKATRSLDAEVKEALYGEKGLSDQTNLSNIEIYMQIMPKGGKVKYLYTDNWSAVMAGNPAWYKESGQSYLSYTEKEITHMRYSNIREGSANVTMPPGLNGKMEGRWIKYICTIDEYKRSLTYGKLPLKKLAQAHEAINAINVDNYPKITLDQNPTVYLHDIESISKANSDHAEYILLEGTIGPKAKKKILEDWSGLNLEGKFYADCIDKTADEMQDMKMNIYLDHEGGEIAKISMDASELINALYKNVMEDGVKVKGNMMIVYENINHPVDIEIPQEALDGKQI